jgi:hypothetical protein
MFANDGQHWLPEPVLHSNKCHRAQIDPVPRVLHRQPANNRLLPLCGPGWDNRGYP